MILRIWYTSIEYYGSSAHQQQGNTVKSKSMDVKDTKSLVIQTGTGSAL